MNCHISYKELAFTTVTLVNLFLMSLILPAKWYSALSMHITACRLSSVLGRVIPKTCRIVGYLRIPALCSVLMGACKETCNISRVVQMRAYGNFAEDHSRCAC